MTIDEEARAAEIELTRRATQVLNGPACEGVVAMVYMERSYSRHNAVLACFGHLRPGTKKGWEAMRQRALAVINAEFDAILADPNETSP